MFIDKTKVFLKAGDGGSGCASFRREKFVPNGGPDGGNGGKGGNIVFVSVSSKTSLLDFKYHPHIKALSGAHGKGKNQHGHAGKDHLVEVPVGTTVIDAETRQVLHDFAVAGETLVMAEGGKGGRGNAAFSSSTRQAPKIAQEGVSGEEKVLELELKLVGDMGLIGFPNAGKSTLINKLSAAKSKVASYPFTTIEPVIGILRFDDYYDVVILDIPGLIEGAHRNVGLGHQFLKHVERSRCLLFVIDGAPYDESDPCEVFEVLQKELLLHRKELTLKPRLITFNKMDLPDGEKNYQKFVKKYGKNEIIIPIAALKGEGLKELMLEIRKKVEESKKKGEAELKSPE